MVYKEIDLHFKGLLSEQNICDKHLLVLFDSVSKSKKSIYPQALLEKCKYLAKDKQIRRLMTEDLMISED